METNGHHGSQTAQHRQGPQGFPLKRGRGQGDNELGYDSNQKAEDIVLYFSYVLFVTLCHYANMIVIREQRTLFYV